MTDIENDITNNEWPNQPKIIPNARVVSRTPFSSVWILPILALLVGGWLVYQSFAAKGPVITVSFKHASGIESRKTVVKYRDINVGLVKSVHFSDDLSHIQVTIQMHASVEKWLTKSTLFWVVKPRVDASRISGLSTLVSGTHIALDPGHKKETNLTTEWATEFVGLEEPPGIASDATGTLYQLLGTNLGSISIGSVVLYRQIKVGKVVNYRLANNHRHVEIDIFVNAPHDQFVKTNSHFWNASGIEVGLDASGIKLDVAALSALLMGGIAFDTPLHFFNTKQAPPSHVFTLNKNNEQWQNDLVSTASIPYLLYFDDTVRGLSPGAPVEFRGIRVGTVSQISINTDVKQDSVRISVLIEIEPKRMPPFQNQQKNEINNHSDNIKQMLKRLVTKGLRARLQTGNLMTGQLLVELGMFGEADKASMAMEGELSVMPTTLSTLNNIERRISQILTRVEQLSIEKIVNHLENSAKGIDELLNKKGLNESLIKLNSTLDEINTLVKTLNASSPSLFKSSQQTLNQLVKTLVTFDNLASENGPMGGALTNALDELSAAARSIRIMAEYLERHPEALLKGKKGSP